jgi:hypothetical protein
MVASQLVTNLPLLEGFTSSTCAPCASFYNQFDPILNNNNPNGTSNPGIANVKYQMNWPSPGNDPSYNPDGVTRRTYYGVSGIPNNFYDGNNAVANNQAEIDFYKNKQTPMAMTCTYSSDASGAVSVTVNVTPYVNIPSGARLHIAVLEKEYDYAASTTSQDVFKHVMRKMLPNGNGTTISNLVDGTPQTFTQSYTFNTVAPGSTPAQGSYDLWVGINNLEVVAFVQNNATREVYQSVVGTKVASINNLNAAFNVNLYPNPVANNLTIALDVKKAEMARIDIVNMLGQTVQSLDYGQVNGSQMITMDASNLTNGLYFARVTIGDQVETIKFNVVR